MASIVPALPRWLATNDDDRRAAIRAIADEIAAGWDEFVDVLRFEFDLDEERAKGQVRRSCERVVEIAEEVDAFHDRIAPGICTFVLSRHREAKVLSAAIARVLLNESIVVIKPSLGTPLTVHLLMAAICRAVPAGTVNLIHGDEETADALVSSPLVGSVLVDGSEVAASHVSRLGATFAKPVIRYADDARFFRGQREASSPHDCREDSVSN